MPVAGHHLQVAADLTNDDAGPAITGAQIAEPLSVPLGGRKKRRGQRAGVPRLGGPEVQGRTVAQNNVGCHTLKSMGDHLTTSDVARMAAHTHVRAARLSRSSSVFGWWHERKFVDAIHRFIGAMRSLSQREIERAKPSDIHDIGTQIDGIIEAVEAFVARHGGGRLRRVERNRHLVRHIYELRASFEKLSRGVTAQPGMTDVRWTVRMDTAHRGRP